MNNIIITLIFFFAIAGNAFATPYWTEWKQLQDTAYNGIYFSHKSECASGDEINCKLFWSFKSKYNQPVNVTYKITYLSPGGSKGVHTGTANLKEGENELPEFHLFGKELQGVSVGIIGFANAKAKIQEEQRQQEEARLQREEDERRRQAAQEEYWRQHPQEYQALLAEQRYQEDERERQELRREQAEERRREEAQEERRQAREEERENSRQQAAGTRFSGF
jgi:hypothetical protein